MDADLTRGHRPDAKRGKTYRRVLVKQGAAILDSDLAAMVDTGERMVREAVTHAGCRHGSPDLGFLVTPGELLALFDPIEGVGFTATAPAEAERDFARKYLDRFPGLRIRGGGGSVAVPLRRTLPAPTPCVVWLRSDDGATARINGTDLTVTSGAAYAPFPVTLSGGSLTLEPANSGSYWLGLVETAAPSTPGAALHWAAGEYQIDGVIAKTAGAAWPGIPAPAGSAFETAAEAPDGTRIVAYLELSERHVTHIEDAGILEQALGGDHTTSTRSEVAAQIKLARAPAGATPETVAAAIAAPALPDGTVTIETAGGTESLDPCDLPVPGGYTGGKNRLYRMVVHDVTTGGSGRTLFKWSRENGSELFPVIALVGDPVTGVTVRSDLPLRQGDLVEILSSASDLGDSAAGLVGSAGFRRPVRQQGRLVRLQGGSTTDQATRTFTLREPDGSALGVIPAGPIGSDGIKLRRWSGLITRPGTGALNADLEDGIGAAIDGNFEPGDWWQYEARALAENANGPTVPTPHGPERLFAPLALLQQTAPGQPMDLVAWLDTRYRRLCDLQADTVAFDGGYAGTEADTVQEALDELYLRVSDGCGVIAVPPDGSIQDVIDAIPAGGSAKICLNAGTRDLTAAVSVVGKGDLVITGTGPGTRLRRTPRQVFSFRDCRSVDLRDFAIETGGTGDVLSFRNVGEVRIAGLTIRTAGGGGHAIAIRAAPGGAAEQRVSITDNRLSLGQDDSGILVVESDHVVVRDNVIAVRDTPLDIAPMLDDPRFLKAVGNVLLDRIDFLPDESDYDFMSSVLSEEAQGPAKFARAAIVMAPRQWGRPLLRFTTHRLLSAADWERISEDNRAPNGNRTLSDRMDGFLRRFGARLARAMFNITTGDPATVAGTVRPSLNLLRNRLLASNERSFGQAGIVVATNAGASVRAGRTDLVPVLFPRGRGRTMRVNGNRISGFMQGIRVAGSLEPHKLQVVHAADICENHIHLRLPMQAHQRHGILLGNALSARVLGNRVENLAYLPSPTNAVPDIDCDAIRLWGAFGPLVELRGNVAYGLSVGVRVHDLATGGPTGVAPGVSVRAIADNGFVGDGASEILSS